jgi:hypothetical protein
MRFCGLWHSSEIHQSVGGNLVASCFGKNSPAKGKSSSCIAKSDLGGMTRTQQIIILVLLIALAVAQYLVNR